MYKELYDIPKYKTWKYINKINNGWSEDYKYYIEDNAGNKFLLRLSAISTYDKKRKEFEIIKKFNSLDFVMSRAIELGICNNEQNVYMLLTWIDGNSLDAMIGDLTENEQYELGLKAGKILKGLHSIKVDDKNISIINKKENMLKKLNKYINSTVRIEGDQIAIDFVKKNIDRINPLPPVYKHGDFHVGNLILDSHRQIGIIDFNRWECGDKYEEFYKIQSFDLEVSIPFAIGQVDGYFNFQPPDEFWNVLAVYVAYASLYSIAWAEKFGEDEIKNMKKRCMRAFSDYNNFHSTIPRWYKDNYMNHRK